MSDIDLAISQCKYFESQLTKNFKANGKGLHEKISSIEDELPGTLIRKMRYIATIRNKIIHEADYQKIDDRKGFKKTCKLAKQELQQLTRNRQGLVHRLLMALLFYLIIALLFMGVSAFAIWKMELLK